MPSHWTLPAFSKTTLTCVEFSPLVVRKMILCEVWQTPKWKPCCDQYITQHESSCQDPTVMTTPSNHTVAAEVRPLKRFGYALFDHLQMFIFSSRIAKWQTKGGGAGVKQFRDAPRALGFSFNTLHPELMLLIRFVKERSTHQGYFIQSAILSNDQCVSLGMYCIWIAGLSFHMTMNFQEDWCTNNINVDLIYGTIPFLSKVALPEVSAFQWPTCKPWNRLSHPVHMARELKGWWGQPGWPLPQRKPPSTRRPLLNSEIILIEIELLEVNKLAVGFSCLPVYKILLGL